MKKYIKLLLAVTILFTQLHFSQNAIVGTGFTDG